MDRVIRKKHAIFFISLFLVSVISWLPILIVPFINDDFQILGFHLNKNFFTAFEPFWEKDISQFYWRPLGNLLHPIILMLFGFNALPFRILSLLLNIFCGITLYKILEKLGIDNTIVMAVSVLFCLLPSHEFQIAWIADQGEVLLAIFLMMSLYNYLFLIEKENPPKYLFISLSWFTAAVLVKETAYAGILIPWIGILYYNKIGKSVIKKAVIHSLYFLSIIIILILYRLIVVGSSPLGSSHFAELNPVKMILNFLVYFLLAFFPPETLEWLQFNLKNIWFAILLIIICLLLVYYIIRQVVKLSVPKKKIFFMGLAWFVIFILPAVPVLMRWYVYTASIGLLISFSVLIEPAMKKVNKRIIFWIPAIIILIFLGLVNFNRMIDWSASGGKLQSALNNFSKMKPERSMFIWAVPDKYNRIPMMKLGVKETVQWTIKNKNIEVFAPLRVELIGIKPEVKLVSASTKRLEFVAINGRFMKEGGKSKYLINNEIEKFEYEGNQYEIETYVKENILYSKVKIFLNEKIHSNFDQYYFDGEKFRLVFPLK